MTTDIAGSQEILTIAIILVGYIAVSKVKVDILRSTELQMIDTFERRRGQRRAELSQFLPLLGHVAEVCRSPEFVYLLVFRCRPAATIVWTLNE